MSISAQSTTDRPRAVTDDEVAAYREQGWVKLDGFITSAAAAELLANLKSKMGESADRARASRGKATALMWRNYENPSRDDGLFKDFACSRCMGQVGLRLLGRDVRFWSDSALVKMPVGAESGSQATSFHQDYPAHPHDRSGTMTIWIALADIPPERGGLRFLSRSHRAGIFGRTVVEGVDLLEVHPELLNEYTLTDPINYRAGDATVHNSMTIHGAPPNRTDEPRWAYVVSLLPADTLFTGAPHWLTDQTEGVEPNKRFPDHRFPVLSA